MEHHEMDITSNGYKQEVGVWRNDAGGGMIGDPSELIGAAPPLHCCTTHKKWDMAIVRIVQENIEQGRKGKKSRKIRAKVFEGEFTHIGARRNIIISKMNIFHWNKK